MFVKITNLTWLFDKLERKVKKLRITFANDLAYKLTDAKLAWATLILKCYLEAFIFDKRTK